MTWIEPVWKLLLSNKGILPILWQLYPNHPLLLPAYFEDHGDRGDLTAYVRKPLHSREGANISILQPGKQAIQTGGPVRRGAVHPAGDCAGGCFQWETSRAWLVDDRPGVRRHGHSRVRRGRLRIT